MFDLTEGDIVVIARRRVRNLGTVTGVRPAHILVGDSRGELRFCSKTGQHLAIPSTGTRLVRRATRKDLRRELRAEEIRLRAHLKGRGY